MRNANWSHSSKIPIDRPMRAPVVMVLIVVPTAMAVIAVAESVANNLAHILLQFATIPIVVITMMPEVQWNCQQCPLFQGSVSAMHVH